MSRVLGWRHVALGIARMPAAGVGLSAGQLAQVISQWQKNRRYRRDLRRLYALGPHAVADIGLSTDDVIIEMAKPFWKS